MFKENVNVKILLSKKLHTMIHGRGFSNFFCFFTHSFHFSVSFGYEGGDGGFVYLPYTSGTEFYSFSIKLLEADLYTVHQSLLF